MLVKALAVAFLVAAAAAAQEVVFVDTIPFTLRGIAAPNEDVVITIAGKTEKTRADANGRWQLVWTAPLKTGTYTVRAGKTTLTLRVQLPERLPRQPGIARERPAYAEPVVPDPDAAEPMTDRWRIAPPPYELDDRSRGRLDPYNRNILKGDYPIRGNDTFFVLTGISDTLAESRSVPTPSGVSASRPASFPFFGDSSQNVFVQNAIISADLFEGDTAFEPVRRRLKATVVANFNHVRVRENAIVKPDVRRGRRRNDGRVSLQELFYEHRLATLSANFDFLSIRAGSQPFSSDFRGFVFTDTNLGVRLFGNLHSNRWQYNLAYFERLEKDTNSGLNTLDEFRGQRVAVANFYVQDFLWRGYTQQVSVHYMRDDGGFHYDRNGILARPAPVGSFTPHRIDAAYIGQAGLGHIGRINIDHALYFVFGRDTMNPIAGPDPELRGPDSVRIGAAMAALEVSYDRDWLRPRFALFYATGDRSPRDRKARGFDSIYDSASFAGGGFSFFNRLGIRLAGSGVALVERGSLLTSLRSSKDEGQPNYVNPGVQLASLGLDVEVTPRLKAIFTANYIRFDSTRPIEELLFQDDIDHELGTDISLGLRYRPFLSNNWIITGGTAAFFPGRGFEDIYESRSALYHLFTNVTLTF